MKALVLCGGYGTRLGKLTRERPKCLLTLGGEPLLAHTLRYLAHAGFDRVAVNVHYRADEITASIGDGARFGVRVHWLREETLLGTAGTLRRLRPFFASEEAFLTMYGDLLTDQPIGPLLEQHRRSSAAATLLLHRRVGSNSVVRMDEDRRITAFLERPNHRASADAWVNSGFQVLGPRLLDAVPDATPCDLPRDVYAACVDNERLFGFPLSGYRCAIDSPVRYAEAQRAFADGRYRAPRT